MSGIFSDHPQTPRFYQTPPGAHLSRLAARGLLRRLGWPDRPDPVALAEVTICVGTRRAARALREAFAEEAGGPVLTPRILAFPDFPAPPEAPPAAAPLRRTLILAKLVRGLARAEPDLAREEGAVALAEQLGDLLDEIHASGADLEALQDLAPEDHAEHWGKSLTFLNILREAWPLICARERMMDPEARRLLAMRSLMAHWRDRPPRGAVLALGEAGRTEAERDFLRAVAHLPQGAVVLPWLDDTLGAEEWAGLEAHPEHPARDLAALLSPEGFPRKKAPWWEAAPAPALLARARLWGHALRPAPVTDAWRASRETITALAPPACAGISLIEAGSSREEASVVAAVMRRVLAESERSVALVTPDRGLGRRVAAALARWGIAADDSGGRPLALTPPGVLMSLLAQAFCVAQADAAEAVSFLGLMKHPLTASSDEEHPERRRAHLRLTRRYELFALRGRRAPPGLEGLRALIEMGLAEAAAAAASRSDPEAHRLHALREAEALRPWFAALQAKIAPFAALASQESADMGELLAAHRAAALDLTEGAVERGPTGELLAGFLDRLKTAAADFGEISPQAWPSLFADLLKGEAARPPGGGHRRAFIWGPADARAQSAEVVILGGLNEGVWPEIPQPDGWLSRPMRQDLKLPPLEARVGRLALDFSQICCSGSELWLTRARKAEGSPASASRWLRRLETLLSAFAPEAWAAMGARGAEALEAALRAETDFGPPSPEPRPAPCPPVRRRPLRLSVTAVETLARDPYQIYASRILGLSALAPIGAEPDALLRGRLLHQAVEAFSKATRKAFPPLAEAQEIFARELDAALAELADRPAVQASWRARGLGFAAWFLPSEAERRARGDRPALLEGVGASRFMLASGRAFTLTAKADRIDETAEGYALIDYKTGRTPSDKEMQAYARQLPLEGAMLREGGFSGLEPAKSKTIAAYRHIPIRPAGKDGKEKLFKAEDLDGFADRSLAELKLLLAAYEDAATPYLPRLMPKHLKFAGDFDHLSRFGEWGGESGGDEDDGAEDVA